MKPLGARDLPALLKFLKVSVCEIDVSFGVHIPTIDSYHERYEMQRFLFDAYERRLTNVHAVVKTQQLTFDHQKPQFGSACRSNALESGRK